MTLKLLIYADSRSLNFVMNDLEFSKLINVVTVATVHSTVNDLESRPFFLRARN